MTQTTLREYLRVTEDAISSGRFDEAMANCQNILTYFPEALEAQRLLGEVYLAQNQLEEAQQAFEWILTNDPENVIVYCSRALISQRTADIDTALDCYQQAYELSRGNVKIREAFNQLSMSVGQQEFMFSRAGLARLYMRGNLLTQAVQEWEAVLAVSPERLDARLGLMETYWREGLYSKAEQTAIQLLEEIPTCLKALLYLAHMASISNIQRAKELLRRVEALDPELHAAQEIFADLSTSIPNDPFLELLKREPILLENGVPTNLHTASVSVPVVQASVLTPEPAPEVTSSAYGGWDMLENWEKPVSASEIVDQAIPETPSRANWENGSATFHATSQYEEEMPTWQGHLEQQPPRMEKGQPWYQADSFAQASVDPKPETQSRSKREGVGAEPTQSSWNNEQQNEEQLAHPAWLDTLTRNEQLLSAELLAQAQAEIPPVVPEVRSPVLQEPKVQENQEMPFFFPSDEGGEEETSWPDWLKSLGAETLEPEQPPSAELPEQRELNALSSAKQTSSWEAPQASVENQLPAEADPWAAFPAMSANNDVQAKSNKQPEWMQQLSALESMPIEAPIPDWMQQVSAPERMAAHQSAEAPVPDWMQQLSIPESAPAQPTEASVPDWMQQLSASENKSAQAPVPDWMQQLSTSESVPAQPTRTSAPDWMQQLTSSQAQDAYQSELPEWAHVSNDNMLRQEAELAASPLAMEEEHYLASLADLEKNFQAQGFVPLTPGALASIAQTQAGESTPEQILYEQDIPLSSALAQLGSFSQPVAAPPVNADTSRWDSTPPQIGEQFASANPRLPSEQVNPFAALGVRTDGEAPRQMSPSPVPAATPIMQPPSQVFVPAANREASQRAQSAPVYRPEAQPDGDLEMTMKRPAIKSYPRQTGRPSERPYSNENNQSRGERKAVEQSDKTRQNSHERLVRGYQYQLAGAYDEAMQEYRLIIRNAPELLDDVISNMRALLKFNPRFSLGYRVLGDAYMRRGEYLQAMESYNKALTMAKKGKN